MAAEQINQTAHERLRYGCDEKESFGHSELGSAIASPSDLACGTLGPSKQHDLVRRPVNSLEWATRSVAESLKLILLSIDLGLPDERAKSERAEPIDFMNINPQYLSLVRYF